MPESNKKATNEEWKKTHRREYSKRTDNREYRYAGRKEMHKHKLSSLCRKKKHRKNLTLEQKEWKRHQWIMRTKMSTRQYWTASIKCSRNSGQRQQNLRWNLWRCGTLRELAPNSGDDYIAIKILLQSRAQKNRRNVIRTSSHPLHPYNICFSPTTTSLIISTPIFLLPTTPALGPHLRI